MTEYRVNTLSCLSAFLRALFSFPCTRKKFSSGLFSCLRPRAGRSPRRTVPLPSRFLACL